VETWLSRLLLSLILGSVLGFERFLVRKPAGLRTITLVCVGSTVFILLAERIQGGFPDADPTRIAQGIIAGVGFLGAGTILHRQSDVTGLTTAATVWLAAAVGMAAGLGDLGVALAATAIGILILQGYGKLERWMRKRGVRDRTEVDRRESDLD
jgi:putative Mg2+ transporter-C (MgtC) family protein